MRKIFWLGRNLLIGIKKRSGAGFENPCVGGSIPPRATTDSKTLAFIRWGFFVSGVVT